MDCKDLKKKMLECNEQASENRECKEIIEKFQFECEKEEEKQEEKKGWFGFMEKKEEVKVEGEKKEEDKEEEKEEEKKEEERKKDEDKFDST